MPILAPRMRRVEIPWRTARLPGLLARPRSVGGPAPLVVLLNGSSTAKEETIQWAAAFLERGLAVLALDWPGTGEAAQTTPLTADCDDLTEGVLGLARDDSDLDDARVSLVGISLGGALAVRAAALDRRIAAIVAVTPPYDAPRWLPAASPLLRDHLVAGTGDPALIEAAAAAFALPTHLPRLRAPLLVFGAGRDLVVPPSEALRLAAAVGETATLVWFPRAGHALYEVLPQWTGDAATWISALLRPAGDASTQVDPIPAGADALEEAVLQPRPLESLT
jgi:alpha-beta hydrolase superfamily lysophospholipase